MYLFLPSTFPFPLISINSRTRNLFSLKHSTANPLLVLKNSVPLAFLDLKEVKRSRRHSIFLNKPCRSSFDGFALNLVWQQMLWPWDLNTISQHTSFGGKTTAVNLLFSTEEQTKQELGKEQVLLLLWICMKMSNSCNEDAAGSFRLTGY